MHGKLTASGRRNSMSDQRGGTVWGLRRSAPWLAGLLATVIAGSASPQGNIDAGKTPAQMFADTCSNCHRRPQELRRTTVGFLRQHYTPGAQEAAAMASYLASLPAAADPRAGKDRPKGPVEREKAKAPPPSQQAQDRPQERPKAQLPPKAKRAAEVAKSSVSEVPAEAPQEPVREAPPVVLKLEPFEE
jgi:mono/diheme cytochrome c family protein